MRKLFIKLNNNDIILKTLEKQLQQQETFFTDKVNLTVDLSEYIDEATKHLTPPEIFILDSAYLKMRELIKREAGEVAWHGTVEKHDDKYIITDILVFPQHVSGATVTGVDGEYEMWLANQPDEVFDFLRFHGHSHVNMGVSPSAVDEQYYNSLMTHVEDYYITMITNKADAMYIRFYDKANNICYNDITLKICMESGETYEDWFDIHSVNIQKPTPVVSKYNYQFPSNYHERNVTKEVADRYNNYKKPAQSTGLILISPTRSFHHVKSYAAAAKYILKRYPSHSIDKQELLMWLEQEGCVAIDAEEKIIIDNLYDTEHGITQQGLFSELWEVYDESKQASRVLQSSNAG